MSCRNRALPLKTYSVLREPEVLQIAMRPAVELSYLRKEEQADLFAIMEEMDCTPSHAQAIKIDEFTRLRFLAAYVFSWHFWIYY